MLFNFILILAVLLMVAAVVLNSLKKKQTAEVEIGGCCQGNSPVSCQRLKEVSKADFEQWQTGSANNRFTISKSICKN